MAVFDPSEERMCVRIVYDGAAGAGKTTNLRQLASLFAAQRTTEVSSPAELRGRTLYFDWMQIAAGVVSGFPLLCQVISVPGQEAFSGRRRHLLASADVVVYVCDSSPSAATRALDSLRLVDELLLGSSDPLPIVLQANKQDQPNAIDGKTLLAEAGRPNLHVVEAIATEGIGVIDTFVSAIRTVARSIQARTERDALRIPVRRAEDEHHVLSRLASVPIDLEGAAELLLEEASAAFLLENRHVPDVTPLLAPAPTTAPPDDVGHPRTTTSAPLPTADVPTGFVWPAHTGRSTLRALDLEGDVVVAPGGLAELRGDYVLATSLDARYTDHDLARQALVRAARERTQLDALLVSNTVLVVMSAADGTSWLWTVTPRTERLEPWLAQGRGHVDVFGAAVAHAALVALRRGLAFDPRLEAFGVQKGNLRYAGRLAPAGDPTRAAIDLLLGAIDEIARAGHDVEQLALALERNLQGRLRPDEIAAIAAQCGDGGQNAAKERLVRAIQRVSEAA